MSTTDERLLQDRVAELRELSVEQRAALRRLALRSPRAAEECLEVLLKRWRDRTNRAYIQEVLIAGADHDAWVAQHVQWPDPAREFDATMGRPLTELEIGAVDSLLMLRNEQIALAKELRARAGIIPVAKYLHMVAGDSPLSLRMDYIEQVIDGRITHDAWARDHLPSRIEGDGDGPHR